MRRRVIAIVVYVTLGAITSVAVAWGCAMWSQAYRDRYWGRFADPIDATWFERNVRALKDNEVLSTETVVGFGADWTAYYAASGLHLGPILSSANVIRVGWPFRCLSVDWIDPGTGFPSNESKFTLGVSLYSGLQRGFMTTRAPPSFNSHAVPLDPLWMGFASNEALYAGLLWTTRVAPIALRGVLRRRKGRCAACGYPIGISPVCTECGRPVKPRAAA